MATYGTVFRIMSSSNRELLNSSRVVTPPEKAEVRQKCTINQYLN